MSHHKKSSHLFTGIFIGTVLGGMYSLMFAQKKGSVLRRELSEAKDKGKKAYEILARELQLTGKESVQAVKELYESENFQKFMTDSKMKIEDFAEMAKGKGVEMQGELKKRFEQMAKQFSEKAHDMGAAMKEKKDEWIHQGKKAMDKAEKTVEKGADKIKKKGK